MKPQFRASVPGDEPKIARLLRIAFGADSETFSAAELNHWKYWDERPGWPGARSFVLDRDGELISHAAVWPGRLSTSEGDLSVAHVIDWAAEPQPPGLGITALKRIISMVDVVVALGGTQITREILPVFGFAPAHDILYFSKPLRPWTQMRTHPRRNWKLIPRLARNTVLSRRGNGGRTDCRTMRVSPPEITAWPTPSASRNVFMRSPEGLAFLLRCPAVDARLYAVERGGAQIGFFSLAFGRSQCRLADAWAASGTVDDWADIYRAAVRTARSEPGANELVTIAGLPEMQSALRQCGFTCCQRLPLMMHVKRGEPRPGVHTHFQLVDNDGFFLQAADGLYWS